MGLFLLMLWKYRPVKFNLFLGLSIEPGQFIEIIRPFHVRKIIGMGTIRGGLWDPTYIHLINWIFFIKMSQMSVFASDSIVIDFMYLLF